MRSHIFKTVTAAVICAVSLLPAVLGADKTQDKAAQIRQEDREKADAALEQAKKMSAGNTGKLAVIKRLQALFSGASDPVITQTREFKPRPPYISVHELPSSDPATPKRSLIIYRLRFMTADSKTQDAIEGLVGESGTIEISEKQNTVVLNVPSDQAEGVKAALLALDQPFPQVLVETQVIEIMVGQGDERDVQVQYTEKDGKTGTIDTYGYNLNAPGQSGNGGQASGFNFFPVSKVYSDGGFKHLQVALNWLATSTDAKILASPNIIADLGADAKMTTGEEIPYAEAAVTNTAVSQNIKFKTTGINLSIKPIIINDDTVRLEIKPEIKLAVRYQTFETQDAKSTVPVVSIRNISTTLTAADGEIIMLGGLYSSEVTEQLRKTPFFSELPLVGELFTAKSKSVNDKQLLFFMKIHILKSPYSVIMDPEANAAVIQDIGRSIRDSNTLFKMRSRVELENQRSFFSLESILHPKSKSFFEELIGDEAGYEKRTPPRKFDTDRKDNTAPAEEGK
ncbi:MAG: type II secretion system protein GspD [Lentisphaeria bacterium]|nr:type II secretion system protein GspD [Lentisphaeria bacterium]